MSARPALANLMKVTWSGTIGTEEIFAYSRWATMSTDDPGAAALILQDEITVMLAFGVTGGPVSTLTSAWPSHVAWTQLKVSPWDAALNKLKAGRTPSYIVLTDTATGSTGSGMPYQCAIGVTTRSVQAGRRKYNRFFLPCPVNNITDGHGVLQDSVATSIAQFFEVGIEDYADAHELVFVNYNPGTTPDLGAAAGCHEIQDVYLGKRIDTIRRRRNEAPEGRQINPILGP